MMLDNPETIRYVNGTLYVAGRGHIWTQDSVYDVSWGKTTVMTFDVKLHHFGGRPPFEASSELLMTFAMSDKGSGWDGTEDFHLRIGCDREERGFYTHLKTFDDHFIKKSTYIFTPGQWHQIRVELTAETVVVYSDETEIISAVISKVIFADEGHIGFLGFRHYPWEIRNLNIEIEEESRTTETS